MLFLVQKLHMHTQYTRVYVRRKYVQLYRWVDAERKASRTQSRNERREENRKVFRLTE